MQGEKSRISILDGDRDKSGIPICGTFEDAFNGSMMMFDDQLIPDMNTGSSLKQHTTASTKETQEFSEECMRVTTTEAYDMFDEEIWNPSPRASKLPVMENEKFETREDPEEEYFRLVRSIIRLSLLFRHLHRPGRFSRTFTPNALLCLCVVCSHAWP